jgi:Integrase core domain
VLFVLITVPFLFGLAMFESRWLLLPLMRRPRHMAASNGWTVDRLIAKRGTAPAHVRCDNGPELTANALRDWCRFSGAGASYIEPGSPWQNPYVESFGSRVRDELLSVELFSSLAEAQVLVEDWRIDYNSSRPHSALGMMAPARFAASWRQTDHQQINRLSSGVDR